MSLPNILPLALGLIIFSFLVTSILVVPFIDLLYRIRLTRRVEGGKKAKALFDRLHDTKAGTPIGGGILIILVVSGLFGLVFPLITYMGVFVESAYNLREELKIIFITFISFGLLGVLDDVVKTFGRPRRGALEAVFGLTRKQKFWLQILLAFVVAGMLYQRLGIHILHIPLLDVVWDLGLAYIPFAMAVIVFFVNAFNFTDGLDGLASGLLLIYLFSYIFIAAGMIDTPLFVFISIWIGAVVAFLYFNVWPARIWLGDAGALSFGAMIAVIGLMTGNVATMVVIGGAFVIEAVSSAVQILGWKILKRPIFPLAPIHHTFLAIGWEEPKIVMRAWLMGIILAILGLWLATI